MKKALPLLLLAFPLWLWAQPYYQSLVVHTDFPSNVQKSIIKELHFPASISYVETSAEHYFVYHDGTINPLSIVRIHPGLNVKDFEIADDSVFFCGTNAAGEGFFGHFDINSFFQMQHSYSVTDFTFQLLTGSVVSFDKMVAFRDGLKRKLAAVGRTSQGNYVTAEVFYAPNNSLCTYRIGTLNNGNYVESLLDITLVNDCVVTAGMRMFPSNAFLTTRVYKQSGMFVSNGPQNTYYYSYFQYGNPPHHFDASQLVLSHIQGDRFAVALYWQGVGSTTNSGTYIGLFNVVNYAIGQVNSIYTMQYYNNGGWKLREITPVDTSLHFYMLQNAEVSGSSQLADIIYELDMGLFASPPSALAFNTRTRTGEQLQSIDTKGNCYGFVSNGSSLSTPQRLMYYDARINSMNCFTVGTVADMQFLTAHNPAIDVFTVSSGSGQSFTVYFGQSVTMVNGVDCTE